MILIADSGSTKTDWLLFDKNGNDILAFNTIGMNPFFVDELTILEELKATEISTYSNQIESFTFYGAGCSTPDKAAFLSKIFQTIFTHATIEVKTDIEGAVLALANNKPCIVSILGTGSTFRVYDGKNILKKYSSLGFIVGDEGSGTHIGKSLLRAIYYNRLGNDFTTKFENFFQLSKEEIIENIYQKPRPNKFLASFTPFCKEYINHPEIEKIVLDSFENFFKEHILPIEESKTYPLHFIGSIAYYFETQLKKVAHKHTLKIGKIEQKPLKLLKDYHLSSHCFKSK